MAKQNQVWATLSDEMYQQLEAMAIEERRKMTQMAAILLENAIKERQRKRKKSAKDE